MHTYYRQRTAPAVFASLVAAAFVLLAFGTVFLAVLAVNMPGVPARNIVPVTTLIACPAQPVQFACRVSGGQQ